jgi:hypothetical protein
LIRSTPGSNAPESEALTSEDIEIFDAARQATAYFKKSFEQWATVGRAVVRAREIADRRGGAKTFMRLIQQQELAWFVTKQVATHLLRVMERINEVTTWRETLTEKQKFDWASPVTILRRCPIFNSPTPPSDPERLTPAERDRQQLAAALEEINQLRQQLSQRQDGDTFDPRRSPAQEIALALFGQLQPYRGKAKMVAKLLTALVKQREREGT